VACVVAAVVGLQLGALGVVVQTVASGISSLPPSTFLWLMLPIHLAIGLAEGLATAALVLFVRRARPDLVERDVAGTDGRGPARRLVTGLAIAAAFTGGVLSWFASAQPDGLEWSIERAAGASEIRTPEGGWHERLAALQERLVPMPDYDLRSSGKERAHDSGWPAVSPGKSLAGVVGGFATLLLVTLAALLLKRRH
jgi:cobalt/nickel transport system permease protein